MGIQEYGKVDNMHNRETDAEVRVSNESKFAKTKSKHQHKTLPVCHHYFSSYSMIDAPNNKLLF